MAPRRRPSSGSPRGETDELLGPPLLASICPRGVTRLVKYSTGRGRTTVRLPGTMYIPTATERVSNSPMYSILYVLRVHKNLHQGKNKPNDVTRPRSGSSKARMTSPDLLFPWMRRHGTEWPPEGAATRQKKLRTAPTPRSRLAWPTHARSSCA